MPISRRDFNLGRTEDSTEEKVLRLLEEHPQEAYTSVEIAKAIGHSSHHATPPKDATDRMLATLERYEFSQELQALVSQGKIESRTVAK